MNAETIARALGAARRAGWWWSCCCPAHDDRSPSLSLCDGHRAVIVRCWAGCDPRDVLAELRRLGLNGGDDGCRITPGTAAGDGRADTARRIALARRIWAGARNAAGSHLTRYLAARHITMAPLLAPRYAPALRRPDGTCGPAMVARIDNLDGELIGVHRTWIDRGPDGIWRRRNRAMLGRAASGAVRLAPAAETLLIGEGIETVLSGMVATGLPGWAALSTSGMVALALPPDVREVVILADHDASGAGERAAGTAAARWLAKGRRVRIAMPPDPGTDFADVLTGCCAEVRNAAA